MTKPKTKKAVVTKVFAEKREPVQSLAVHPGSLIQLAMNTPDSLDLDKLSGLFDLQERFEENLAKKAYYAAMARFSPPKIVNDQDVAYGTTDYSFASLAGAIETIKESLNDCGLKHSWKVGNLPDGAVEVTCFITHELGYQQTTSMFAPPDMSGGKNPIQGMKSTVSYLQRITLFALLGLASKDDDDDGRSFPDQTRGAVGAGSSAPEGPPDYPQDQFEKNIDSWEQLIVTAKATPESIIAKISTKYIMTDDQREQLNKMRIK